MSFYHRSSKITPKFVATYSKLFQGFTPHQISPQEEPNNFFSNLLDLDVNREYIEGELNRTTKETCLGGLKPILNLLFRSCLAQARNAKYDDVKKSHALETLSVIVRCVLAKNLTGWEVMEVMAGGVGQSDIVFLEFTGMVNDMLADTAAPASIRHQALQLALIYMCGIGQLSPGAYFLRRDLFPSVVSFIKSPDTEQYTFEAVIFLAVLANFHKSDAAKLNPYLRRIKDTTDEDLMRKIHWASNFALDAAIKAFREISDDSVKPTFTTTLGSVMASLRPDRALSSTPVDPPRELFKDQPIEACVILLPIFEFLRANPTFSRVLLGYLPSDGTIKPGPIAPPLFTILTLSSYLLTHASSTSSPRSIAYADLCLHILLAIVTNDEVMKAFCLPTGYVIHICRQRLPVLPAPRPRRAPVCALLDCCVLWLRHNLHKRLEVNSYTICIWICYQVIWFLQERHIRIEYEWQELWIAILGLLNFLSTKIDSLASTGGVERLIQETILLLDLSITKSESYLPCPAALHEFVYELVRSSSVLKKQAALLKSLALPHPESQRRISWLTDQPGDTLTSILDMINFYEQHVAQTGARTAKEVMRVVEREIEKDGLHGVRASRKMEAPSRSEDVLGFARYVCTDGLALMP